MVTMRVLTNFYSDEMLGQTKVMKVIILHAYNFLDIGQICQKQICQMSSFLRSSSNDLMKWILKISLTHII